MHVREIPDLVFDQFADPDQQEAVTNEHLRPENLARKSNDSEMNVAIGTIQSAESEARKKASGCVYATQRAKRLN